MKISGTPLAKQILSDLKLQISQQKLSPHLAIILATDNPAPKMYVSIKLRRAAEIGLKTTVYDFSSSQSDHCLRAIRTLNHESDVHGILVQVPMYQDWLSEQFIQAVTPEKDVDGFLPNSKFLPATGLAVWEMLQAFATHEGFRNPKEFLNGKTITILGKGRTAGQPAIDLLRSKGFNPTIIDSKTTNPDQITIQSDVIISAVGKRHLIHAENIKPNSYIIGIGVGKQSSEGKEQIFGDIDENSIKAKAKLYCPTIGGIGPLTIACLLRNVVESAKQEPHVIIRK